ncbi:MAG: hypothetical protein K8R54_08315 [Bacteroidales bacterium]|nr:hypothetical protein [Bacteroidales bacterium]
MKITKKLTMVLLLAIFASSCICVQPDYDRILEIGITGKGIIIKVENTNVKINDDPQVRLYLTIYSKDQEPFDAQVKMVVSRVSVPRQGDWVAVKYDPEDNQKVIWIEDNDYTPEIEEEIKQIGL